MKINLVIARAYVGLLGVLSLCGSGCMSLRQHNPPHGAPIPASLAPYATHLDQPLKPGPDPLAPEERAYLSRPFVIEFDDEGELWEAPVWPKAENAPAGALSQFEQARAAIRLARAKSANLTVLVFVHGWKHDANLDDFNAGRGNLASFTQFIVEWNAKLAQRHFPDDAANPPLCLGVFIAWRGTPWTAMRDESHSLASILNEVPLNLTIWNRLAAADRIGRSTATQVMLTLAGEAKRDDLRSTAAASAPDAAAVATSSPAKHAPARVVFVGHSMGARILEHSLAQAMIGARLLAAPQAQAEYRSALEEIMRLEREVETLNREIAAARKESDDSEAKIKTLESECERASKEATAEREAVDKFSSNNRGVEQRGLDLVKAWIADKYDKFKKFFQRTASEPAEQTAEKRVRAEIERIDAALAGLPAAPTDEDDTSLVTELRNARAELMRAHKEMIDGREKEAAAIAALQASLDREKHMTIELESAKSHSDSLKSQVETRRNTLAGRTASLAQARRRRDAALARPADLILLFNPASEALVSRQIAHALNAPSFQGPRPEDQLPWIISVTSDADWATRRLYPLGAFFRGLVRDHRVDNQQALYFSRPAPHIDEFCNFELKFVQSLEARSVKEESVGDWIGLNLSGFALDDWLHAHPELPANNLKKPSRQLRPEDKDLVIAGGGIYTLDRRTETPVNDHPAYWIIKADRGLIRDHNDEFSLRAHALVSALLRISETLPSTTSASERDKAATEQKAAAVKL